MNLYAERWTVNDNNDGIWITSLNFSGNWLSDEKAVFFCVMV